VLCVVAETFAGIVVGGFVVYLLFLVAVGLLVSYSLRKKRSESVTTHR